MKSIYLLLFSIFAIFFTACSSKAVYEPKIVEGVWQHQKNSNLDILDVSPTIAQLDDKKILSKDGIINFDVANGYRVLSKSDGWILSTNTDGNLTMQYISDRSLVEHFELKKTIASASVKDDILAVLFANNDMALYSISTKKILLEEQGSSAIVVDSKVVAPYFMKDLVIFSTLDGKIVIINSRLKKKLRTMIVSSEKFFNNIIYFDIIDNKMIAVTGTNMLSLSQKEIRAKYETRDLVHDDTTIFITTKQGEVISLTPDLQVNAKLKFPFAHFMGMILNDDKLYALEKEGYIIEISKDLLTYKVYEADIDDGFVFVADKVFYVDEKLISVE